MGENKIPQSKTVDAEAESVSPRKEHQSAGCLPSGKQSITNYSEPEESRNKPEFRQQRQMTVDQRSADDGFRKQEIRSQKPRIPQTDSKRICSEQRDSRFPDFRSVCDCPVYGKASEDSTEQQNPGKDDSENSNAFPWDFFLKDTEENCFRTKHKNAGPGKCEYKSAQQKNTGNGDDNSHRQDFPFQPGCPEKWENRTDQRRGMVGIVKSEGVPDDSIEGEFHHFVCSQNFSSFLS